MSEPFSVGNFLDATLDVALIYEYDNIIREMIWLLYPTFEMDLCTDDSPYAALSMHVTDSVYGAGNCSD